jgi:hypothetical protein
MFEGFDARPRGREHSKGCTIKGDLIVRFKASDGPSFFETIDGCKAVLHLLTHTGPRGRATPPDSIL